MSYTSPDSRERYSNQKVSDAMRAEQGRSVRRRREGGSGGVGGGGHKHILSYPLLLLPHLRSICESIHRTLESRLRRRSRSHSNNILVTRWNTETRKKTRADKTNVCTQRRRRTHEPTRSVNSSTKHTRLLLPPSHLSILMVPRWRGGSLLPCHGYLTRRSLHFLGLLHECTQRAKTDHQQIVEGGACLLYTSPSPRDCIVSRMPSSA